MLRLRVRKLRELTVDDGGIQARACNSEFYRVGSVRTPKSVPNEDKMSKE